MYTLTYRKPIVISLTIFGLIIFLLPVFYFLGINFSFVAPPYFQLALGFSIVAFLPYSVFRGAKKNFTSHARLQEKISYEFTEDKIIITGDTFNSEMDWTKTHKITELKNWFLMYQNIQIANLLPKDAFTDSQIIEFRNLVKSKNIKAKLKK